MSKISLNYRFLEFMKRKYNSIVDDRFKRENYPKMNVKIRSDFYSLDDLGIPIRCSEMNHKTAYGWIKINDNIYHFKTNTSLIGVVDNETLKIQTLRQIKSQFPNEFNDKGKMKQLLVINYGTDILNEI